MNYINVLILSLVCATNSLSHCMENKPTKEAIEAANYRLWHAISLGYDSKVKQLGSEGIANLNTQLIGCNSTPLIIACNNHCERVVKALIELGADVNMQDDWGSTALFYDCCIRELIQAGTDINIRDKNGDTALSYAIKNRNVLSEETVALINPVIKSATKKKITLLLMIYKEGSSYLSFLPKEILKIIITCMHPEEFIMDCALICSLHPQALVDNIPLENLAILIKDETLNQSIILDAWQKKLNGITELLKIQKVDGNKIQEFANTALARITKLLANK
jgi:hypothetical protein